MAHPLCASPPAPVYVTLTQIAVALRDVGLSGDALLNLVATAPAEGTKAPDFATSRRVNLFTIGDCALTSSKWGPSIGYLQVRSLNAGRPELASEPFRSQAQLLSGLQGQARAVKAVYDRQGMGAWSGFTSGNYRAFVAAATEAVAGVGATGLDVDRSEVGPTGPSPTGSIIIGGRLYAPSTFQVSGEAILADLVVTRASLDRNIDEADRLIIEVVDPQRRLLRNELLGTKSTITLDDVVFELTDISKADSRLTLTFTDAAAVDLNRQVDSPLTQSDGTRGAFLRRVVSTFASWVEADIEPGLPVAGALEMEPSETPWQFLGRAAGEVQWRRCAVANRVLIGSDAWLAGRRPPVEVAEFTGGVDTVDLDSSFGVPEDRATIRCSAGLWGAPPTAAVSLTGMGPGDGEWLVSRFQRPDLGRGEAVVTIVRERAALDEPKPPAEVTRDVIATGAYIDGPVDVPDGDVSVTAGAVSTSGLQWPIQAPHRISSRFGQRNGRLHAGIDIAVGVGTDVYAAKAGQVRFVGLVGGYGLLIIIKHELTPSRPIFTRYAHMREVTVRSGQPLFRGQRVGYSGGAVTDNPNRGNSQGPHLHFETRLGESGDTPIDPEVYLP